MSFCKPVSGLVEVAEHPSMLVVLAQMFYPPARIIDVTDPRLFLCPFVFRPGLVQWRAL
jgi:hypothetical protein